LVNGVMMRLARGGHGLLGGRTTDTHQRCPNELRHRLYPILRRNPCRHSAPEASSTPLGELPSITPRTPRPCCVWARTISTGFAVAQKIEHTSGISRIRPRTLIGKPSRRETTKTWPAAMDWAF